MSASTARLVSFCAAPATLAGAQADQRRGAAVRARKVQPCRADARAGSAPARPRAGAAGCQKGRSGCKTLHGERAHHHKNTAPHQVRLRPRQALAMGRRCSGINSLTLNLYRLTPDQGDNHLVAACRAGLFSLCFARVLVAKPVSTFAEHALLYVHSLSHQELLAMSTGWIVIGVLVVLVFFAFGAYNRLVALSQRVGQAFADIDVQLKQRHDLIPNLLETVKGYAAHERGTLDDVVKPPNPPLAPHGPAPAPAPEN